MTVTVSEDGAIRQAATATNAGPSEDDPQLARARDADATTKTKRDPATLPDTHSDMRSVGDWFADLSAWALELGERVWSGQVWDIQPPSPRELVDRARNGWMWDHEAVLLRYAARVGCGLGVAWSVLWYSLAVAGQRTGRFIVVAGVLTLAWYLV